MFSNRRVLAASIGTAILAPAVFAGAGWATAGPVGPLPGGTPTQTISTQKGQLVAVALPHRAARSWRIAASIDPKVLVEVTEGDVGANVVVIFKATGSGTVTVPFALTRGEQSHAFEGRRFKVVVK